SFNSPIGISPFESEVSNTLILSAALAAFNSPIGISPFESEAFSPLLGLQSSFHAPLRGWPSIIYGL
ncbi:hypothetical protein KEJ44_09235, partial [Candidatus Bathyarchaeota archaeon]|nr:hypothetical protein [Candidatus Bathyarchaeota archaeon]